MKTRLKAQSGNILLYVLIAVVLFAALTFILTRQDAGSPGGHISDDTAALKAGELIQYATAARSTIEQMRTMLNVQPTEFSFAKPGDAAYTAGPNNPKVYHPAGGGLNLFTDSPDLYASAASQRGWVSQQGTNIGWSETTASDILFTFVDVAKPICAAINDRLYKSKSIPDLSITSAAAFVNGGADDADFTAATCPSCNGKSSYCVKDSAGAYAFYNVLVSR